MLDSLGLGDGALPMFVRAAYRVLGLRTYLTTGEKESRAGTFRAGMRAPECAGVIHTEFPRARGAPQMRGRDPQGFPGGVHPRRDDPMGRVARRRFVGRSA